MPLFALPFPISVLLLLLTYWCVDIVSPALPTIQRSLSLSATATGLVFSIFFAGRLVTNLPAAWLAERAGPKWAAVVGAIVLMAGSFMAGLAATEPALLIARGLQGGGVAVLATGGLLSVLRMRPGGGAAMTAYNVSSGVGTSAGLLSGGYLTGEFGWRSVFWLSAIVAAGLLVATVLAKPRPAISRMSPTDHDSGDAKSQKFRGVEIAAVAANLLVFGNYSIWVVSLPLLCATKLGFDAGQIGLVLLFVNAVHLGAAFPVGRVIRKSGASRSLAAGFGVVGIGLLFASVVPAMPWLLLALVLYAAGQVAGNSSAGDLILRLGGGGGRAVGAVRLSSDIGLVAGPAAAGALADAAGVEAPFVVLGALALAAMAAMLVINAATGRLRSQPRTG